MAHARRRRFSDVQLSYVYTVQLNNVTFGVSVMDHYATIEREHQQLQRGQRHALGPMILVLDPTACGALSLSGNAKITENGPVIVDSNSTTALQESGNAKLAANSIVVHGGVQIKDHATITPKPRHRQCFRAGG